MNMPREQVIEQEIEICDPHHHLGEHFTPPYLIDELAADVRAGHRVMSTVYVECRTAYRKDGPPVLRPVGETEWVASMSLAKMPPTTEIMGGIIAYADLLLGDAVEEVLAAHVQAGAGRLRGIRHSAAFDPSDGVPHHPTVFAPHLYNNPAFSRGLNVLGRLGLTFDAWVYFHQLGDVVTLALDNPEITIVLDHLGGPLGVGPYAQDLSGARATWRRLLKQVADCENVRLKLGGIGMGFFGFAWPRKPASSTEIEQVCGPVFRECIDLFGVDRCMFESNFPPDARLCDYTTLWNAFKLMTARYRPEERAALLHDTAARTYRLGRWRPKG